MKEQITLDMLYVFKGVKKTRGEGDKAAGDLEGRYISEMEGRMGSCMEKLSSNRHTV